MAVELTLEERLVLLIGVAVPLLCPPLPRDFLFNGVADADFEGRPFLTERPLTEPTLCAGELGLDESGVLTRDLHISRISHQHILLDQMLL